MDVKPVFYARILPRLFVILGRLHVASKEYLSLSGITMSDFQPSSISQEQYIYAGL